MWRRRAGSTLPLLQEFTKPRERVGFVGFVFLPWNLCYCSDWPALNAVPSRECYASYATRRQIATARQFDLWRAVFTATAGWFSVDFIHGHCQLTGIGSAASAGPRSESRPSRRPVVLRTGTEMVMVYAGPRAHTGDHTFFCQAFRTDDIMSASEPLKSPELDPTPIFEHFRGSYGSELLTAAVAHFDVFGSLAECPMTRAELGQKLGLAERPTVVLTTALLAMGLLESSDEGKLSLSRLARNHLVPGTEFDVGNYVGLAATAPGVLEMVDRLRSDSPAGLNDDGAAFIYRDGLKSAMEHSDLAEHFTLALSGRANNVAPVLAQAVSLKTATTLLDVGGGTGIYSIAFLRAHPRLKAIVLDRPEVLKTAQQFAADHGVSDRLELRAGDMFADDLPPADVILLSNVLHDWNVPECRTLVQRCSSALRPGGRMIIHDVLLNDTLSGPLPIALYSAALFTLTEGRAYSAAEYRSWMEQASLMVSDPVPTLIHCHALVGTKSTS